MAGFVDKILGFFIPKDKGQKNQRRIEIDKTQRLGFGPSDEDSINIEHGFGSSRAFGITVDIEGLMRNQAMMTTKYRSMAIEKECESAIEDIVNDAIVSDEFDNIVNLNLSNLKYSDEIKNKIQKEWGVVADILKFNKKGHDIFRRWYIDGRTHYQIVIDQNNKSKGIQQLRPIDSRHIKKVKECITANTGGGDKVVEIKEYYLYNEKNVIGAYMGKDIKISTDAIAQADSGLYDNRGQAISYLHKAIRPLNQLRMMEDSLVIYRIARAPERRIFYIDVGNLPKTKAEEYIQGIMRQYRNKIQYNSDTGEIVDDRKHMHLLEDFWLPRREGGKGTEISTLAGGDNLGQIDDVKFFQRQLYKSLNIPISRLESESGFSLGRSSEITRDEVKFSKFIRKLRLRFSELFSDILRVQLILKNIIKPSDWDDIKYKIFFEFQSDNHFEELKEAEILENRLNMVTQAQEHLGKYYSNKYIRSNILMQSEELQEKINREIKQEIALPETEPNNFDPAAQGQDDGFGGGFGNDGGFGGGFGDDEFGGDDNFDGGGGNQNDNNQNR